MTKTKLERYIALGFVALVLAYFVALSVVIPDQPPSTGRQHDRLR